jgi:hypothetical protein
MLQFAIVVMGLLEALFIIDTELMISRSSTQVRKGESQWSSGQTLAMVMVILPLVEMVKVGFKFWKEPEPALDSHHQLSGRVLVLMSTSSCFRFTTTRTHLIHSCLATCMARANAIGHKVTGIV